MHAERPHDREVVPVLNRRSFLKAAAGAVISAVSLQCREIFEPAQASRDCIPAFADLEGGKSIINVQAIVSAEIKGVLRQAAVMIERKEGVYALHINGRVYEFLAHEQILIQKSIVDICKARYDDVVEITTRFTSAWISQQELARAATALHEAEETAAPLAVDFDCSYNMFGVKHGHHSTAMTRRYDDLYVKGR